jgi:hypothetical protein
MGTEYKKRYRKFIKHILRKRKKKDFAKCPTFDF